MKRFRPSLLAILALTFVLALGGCSQYSKSSRQQRAYAKYVRNSRVAQARQSMKLRPGKVQLPPMPVSDPIASNETGPEAMSSEGL